MARKVETDNEISDRDIRVIAKDYGFEPNIQPDGSIDLDPNIYLFARAMVKEFEQVEAMKRKELNKTNQMMLQKIIMLEQQNNQD